MTLLFSSYEIAMRFQCSDTALIFHKLAFDIRCAREAGRDLIEGRHWVRYPLEALFHAFPWISERTIQRKLDKIIESGILIVGTHNQTAFDRRRWFALGDEEEMMLQLFGIVKAYVEKPAPDAKVPKWHNGKFQNGIMENSKMASSTIKKEEERSKNKTAPPLSFSDQALEPQTQTAALEVQKLSDEWQTWAEAQYPNLASTAKNYPQAISKVCKATNLTPEGLKAVFQFIQKDEFWVKNAISPAGLLTKSKNGLRKIDNILAAMKHSKEHKSRTIDEKLRAAGVDVDIF